MPHKLAKDTVQDTLRDKLDIWQIVNTNDEHISKAIPQSDEFLNKFRAFDVHGSAQSQDFMSGNMCPDDASSPIAGTTRTPPSTPTNTTCTPSTPTDVVGAEFALQ